jgi:chemotaxis protein CheX
MKTLNKVNKPLNVNEILINPVQESIVNILSTMANTLPQTEEPELKSGPFNSNDFTGIIELVSAQKSGSIAISFPKPVVIEIAKRMLGLESDVSDPELKDLVGEITNMMAGGAKTMLYDQGYEFDMAIPKVIEDSENEISHKAKAPIVVLPFTTDLGKFYVELCFIEN